MNSYIELCGYFKRIDPPKNMQPTGWDDEQYYYDDGGHLRHYPPRTRYSHPYSYDPIVLFDTGVKGEHTAYSDRMRQWDNKKFDKSLSGRGEMSFPWNSVNDVQTLLCSYFPGETLNVTRVTEMCNVSNGYPVWLLEWNKKTPKVLVKKSKAKRNLNFL